MRTQAANLQHCADQEEEKQYSARDLKLGRFGAGKERSAQRQARGRLGDAGNQVEEEGFPVRVFCEISL